MNRVTYEIIKRILSNMSNLVAVKGIVVSLFGSRSFFYVVMNNLSVPIIITGANHHSIATTT